MVEDSIVIVDVVEELEVVVVVVDEVVVSEVDDVEVWDVSDIEVKGEDVDNSDVEVDAVTSVVNSAEVVVAVEVKLPILSLVVVETGTVVVEVSVDASVMDDETDADSAEVVTMVVEPGISVDVTMEIGVVANVAVETGGADSVGAIDGMVSVDAIIVELSI